MSGLWPRARGESGFSLVEAVLAAGILTITVVGLVQLTAVGARQTLAAGTVGATAVLAQQKLEQLRSQAWNELGLTSSSASTLERDTPGYVEYLGASGRMLGESGPPAGTVFVRRWSIQSVSAGLEPVMLIQVVVRRYGSVIGMGAGAEECRLVSVRASTARWSPVVPEVPEVPKVPKVRVRRISGTGTLGTFGTFGTHGTIGVLLRLAFR